MNSLIFWQCCLTCPIAHSKNDDDDDDNDDDGFFHILVDRPRFPKTILRNKSTKKKGQQYKALQIPKAFSGLDLGRLLVPWWQIPLETKLNVRQHLFCWCVEISPWFPSSRGNEKNGTQTICRRGADDQSPGNLGGKKKNVRRFPPTVGWYYQKVIDMSSIEIVS